MNTVQRIEKILKRDDCRSGNKMKATIKGVRHPRVRNRWVWMAEANLKGCRFDFASRYVAYFSCWEAAMKWVACPWPIANLLDPKRDIYFRS